MQDLSVTIFQQDLAWQDAPANRAQFARLLPAAAGSALVVLPEMFATGFTMEPAACAEGMDGSTVDWLREQAALHGCAIAGSLAIAEGGAFRNRFLFARPDGALEHYDKRHLFRMAGEHHGYVAGSEGRVIENQAWVIGANRTGVDGKGIDYAGDSVVIDPWGRVVLDAGSAAGVHRVTLAAATLADCREKFPVHLDADAFCIGATADGV